MIALCLKKPGGKEEGDDMAVLGRRVPVKDIVFFIGQDLFVENINQPTKLDWVTLLPEFCAVK